MSAPALEVTGLRKAFYGVCVLDGVSFSVDAGELVGLIGPNGSGKTTAIDCISGFLRPDAGQVSLLGRRVSRTAPHRLAARGLARTFQSVRLFATLTVRENIELGAFVAAPAGLKLRDHLDHPTARSRTAELVERYGLTRVADDPAGSLSYGQRKLMEMAAVLISNPSVVLLDEPVAGVNPTIGNVLAEDVAALSRDGVAVLLVEHNMEFVQGLCSRVVVLDHGVKLADGDPREVLADRVVQEAYLGRL